MSEKVGKYQLVYADPPWHFKVHSKKGEGRSAKKHYKDESVMSIEEIKALPVKEITEDDSILLMWVTDPFLKKGLEVMEAWGFEYKTVAFQWVKQCAKSDGWHMGNGYYTRANGEQCLLGVKYRVTKKGNLRSGKGLKRLSKSVRRLIVSRVREHSRKPDEVYPRVQQLWGDVTKLEMFARCKQPGWDVWGNEVESDIEMESIHV